MPILLTIKLIHMHSREWRTLRHRSQGITFTFTFALGHKSRTGTLMNLNLHSFSEEKSGGNEAFL